MNLPKKLTSADWRDDYLVNGINAIIDFLASGKSVEDFFTSIDG